MAGGFPSSPSSHPSQSPSSCKRSERDKERTRLKERQRRAMTAKIFHGLRKHGGYQLPPRPDTNQVLRKLAKEAGWVVEADGTTYRNKLVSRCPTCGSTANLSTSTTPASRTVGHDRAGDCSTTTSPHSTDLAIFTLNDDENNAKLGSTFHADGYNRGGYQESDSLTLPSYMRDGLSATTAAVETIITGEMTTAFPSLHPEMATDLSSFDI